MADSPEQSTALGIDIGGQTVRLAIVNPSGRIIAQRKAHTPEGGHPRQLLDIIATLARELPRPTCAYAGVGLPGRLDSRSRIVEAAVNLPRLEGVNVYDGIMHAIQRQLVIRSDVATAAYAQWRVLADAPMRFVYLTLGTGVGGVAIIQGTIMDARERGPAQFGHLIVDTSDDAPECRCGSRGCLEACVSGLAVAQTGITPRVVTQLRVGLTQLAHLWAPQMISVGGGVVDHHAELVERAARQLREYQGRLVPPDLTIECGVLPSDEAGVVGAALLAHAAA
ncbi:MAG: ROK family protein [Phycisphaerae bacterium]